jgi:hypothetical protein
MTRWKYDEIKLKGQQWGEVMVARCDEHAQRKVVKWKWERWEAIRRKS